MTELVIRWSAGLNVLSSEKNIPELMFLVAMVNLGTADDVEHAREDLKETNKAENALREPFTNWHTLLMAGMVVSSAFFGGYLVVDTLGTSNQQFLPRLLVAAWMLSGLNFALAIGAKIFALQNEREEEA